MKDNIVDLEQKRKEVEEQKKNDDHFIADANIDISSIHPIITNKK